MASARKQSSYLIMLTYLQCGKGIISIGQIAGLDVLGSDAACGSQCLHFCEVATLAKIAASGDIVLHAPPITGSTDKFGICYPSIPLH